MAVPKKKARTAPVSAEKAATAPKASKVLKPTKAAEVVKAPAALKGKRAKTDWEGVESQYRANVVSLRVIGSQFGISEGAIRKRAKAEGWEKDLSHQVRKAAKEKLVRIESTQPAKEGTQKGTQAPLKDEDVVALAAEVIVTVARDHRAKLRDSRTIFSIMLDELREASENRNEIEEAIIDETKGDAASSKRRGMMLRAVALPSRAGIMVNLSAAMKNIIALERQSFNMDDAPLPSGDTIMNITSEMSAKEAADLYQRSLEQIS
jgi:hypothetical protein